MEISRVAGLSVQAVLILVIAGGGSGSPTLSSGVSPSGLTGCPHSPNCVSTEAQDEKHKIKPFRLKGNFETRWPFVHRVVASIPRTAVVTATDNYIHAQCKSLIFRFVDDLELFLDPSTGIVSIRSASRTGYSDFGANRRRVESLRQELLAIGVIE